MEATIIIPESRAKSGQRAGRTQASATEQKPASLSSLCTSGAHCTPFLSLYHPYVALNSKALSAGGSYDARPPPSVTLRPISQPFGSDGLLSGDFYSRRLLGNCVSRPRHDVRLLYEGAHQILSGPYLQLHCAGPIGQNHWCYPAAHTPVKGPILR